MYEDFHYEYKTVVGSFHVYNGNPYSYKKPSFHWSGPKDPPFA